MRHWRIWLYLIAMIGIIGLCLYSSLPNGITLPRAANQQEAVSQTEVPAKPATAVAQVTTAATAEATDAPTEAPTQTEAVPAEQVNYCVECHTDKDQLVDTAAPEEEVVEESEGAG